MTICPPIAHFIPGHQPRPDRAERRAALALVPGSAALELICPFGDIVDHDVAGDIVERFCLGHVGSPGADDDAEFDLPIGLFRPARDRHRIVRSLNAGDSLGEEDRFGRDRHVRFRGVIGIVQADRDELARAEYRNAVARIALHQWQRRRVDRSQSLDRGRAQCVRREIGDHARQIADAAIGIDQAGLFPVGRAETTEFHRAFLSAYRDDVAEDRDRVRRRSLACRAPTRAFGRSTARASPSNCGANIGTTSDGSGCVIRNSANGEL